jgi:hypothetical protein
MEEEKKFFKFFSVFSQDGISEIPKSTTNLPPPIVDIPQLEGQQQQEAKEPEPKKSKKKKQIVPKTFEVKTIHDYSMDIHKQRDAMFIKRLEETGRLSDTNVRKLPPMVDVLNYISQIPNQPLWFKASQNAIINSKSLKFPDMDVLTRAFIREYMRVPLNEDEHACQNQVCESERRGGFRIRILGIKNNYWCYLCHLYHTNRLYVESLNRKQDTDRVYQIHFFMVQVDIPGEYRLDRTLIGEKDVRGLFGPFPIYNVHNYIQTSSPKGWEESDNMVFRLPQTVLPPSSNLTECCSITQQETGNTCNPSNRTKSPFHN